MKRAKVEEGFNPVYPYGYNSSTEVAPPFVAADGLQENPPGVLSLKIATPLTFNSSKALSLAIGAGLTIVDGKLVSQAANFTVKSPLAFVNNELQINLGTGLNVESNALQILTEDPIQINTDNKLALNLGSGLGVVNNQLQVLLNAVAPIILSNNSLSLAIGSGLGIVNNQLQSMLQASTPLSLQNNNLSINLGSGLQIHDNALQTTLQAQAPLSISNDTLGLQVGTGLTIANNLLRTNLTATAPLAISGANFSLNLASSSGLRNRSGLQVQSGWGLKIAPNNDLTLNFKAPLLMTESGSDEGKLTIKTGSGIIINSAGALQANLGSGITFSNNQIQANLGNGLTFSNNQIAANVGNGLTINNNLIQVAVGDGLTITNGQLTVANNTQSIPSLWTTADPSPNCRVFQERDSKFTLTLSKCGSTVIGTCDLVGLNGTLASLSGDTFSVSLKFDTNGSLLTTSNLSTLYWGYRNGSSVNTTITDAVNFMPNILAYPRSQTSTPKSNTYINTYLRGNTSKPMLLKVSFNEEALGYGIKFTWSGLSAYAGEAFISPTCTFSYITQE
ncbi:fiber [Simian adenovirus 20]|uniref:Fiber n=1 Tax=Simian adenovirus 20 TaxID=585059 RepID=F6KSW0_9ADEN|nr:fiber [Simian adenovirus 20]AEF59065.1 fiber [Simian adenovirus 20]